MSIFELNNLPFLLLLLPLAGFVITIFSGSRIKKIYLLEVFIIFITLILSLILSFQFLSGAKEQISISFDWFKVGSFVFNAGIIIDGYSVLLASTVFIVSFLVHLFSVEYMHGDKRYNRYFAYLSLFTFSMTGIVFTNNLLILYAFWELVGISSYLLIGFWYEKQSASDAAKKAFIANRFGDFGLLIGILIAYITFGTFEINKIFQMLTEGFLPFNSEFWLTLMGILLFCGAIGKSAQFPLHVWLPDAMEGPTPVSALIHAATMVAAGVYFTIRIYPMLSADALLFIAIIGGLSAFISATIALAQNDIKKILAYSTISQLGFMVMGIGVGAYHFAFFHLVTHAFFKACLFLGSGSVIHSMHHEQDINKMGGLRKKLPVTYYTFLLATLALSGIPLTSGFLSKDSLLASYYVFGSINGNYLFAAIGFFVAFLTALYMFRLIFKVFFGEAKREDVHEASPLMKIPLIVLSGLSFFFIFSLNPFNAETGWFVGSWIYLFNAALPSAVVDASNELYIKSLHHVHLAVSVISSIIALTGIYIAYLLFIKNKFGALRGNSSLLSVKKFLANKWYFDELYDFAIVNASIQLSKLLSLFDKYVIDGIVNGSAWLTKKGSDFIGNFDKYVVDGIVNGSAYLSAIIGLIFRRFQTGKVQTYIAMVVFSLIILFMIFN